MMLPISRAFTLGGRKVLIGRWGFCIVLAAAAAAARNIIGLEAKPPTHHPLKATPPLSCWPSQQQQQRHGAPHPAQLQGSTWVSQLWTGEKMDEESGGNITRVGGGGGSVVELYSASPFSSIASLNIRDRESRVDATTTSSSRNRSELLFSP
jgi:hypothetical protein